MREAVVREADRPDEAMPDLTLEYAAEPTAELREQGGSLADALVSAVSRHEAVEEQCFWPAVKEKAADGDPLAAGGVGQETEAREMLTELDGMAPGDPRFIPLMIRFNRAARAHIAYEERQVWPGLRAALTADEAGRLGEELAAAAKASPGRTHQHTRPGPAEGRGAAAARPSANSAAATPRL